MYKSIQINWVRALVSMSRQTFLIWVITVAFGGLLAAHTGKSQKMLSDVRITINESNEKLHDVLSKIEKQTEFKFSYLDDIKRNVKVSVQADDASLSKVLEQIGKSGKVRFRRVNDMIAVSRFQGMKSRQIVKEYVRTDINVSGKVTDENGEGLPGASVVVKGTALGTTTDINGNYKLSIPENSQLVVSFVGYKTVELSLAGRSVIDIQMELDAEQLEEVVVVGYGTQRKKDLTGAIASVNSEDLEKIVLNTPDQALQGRVAGVQVRTDSHAPGGSITVQVRGTSSISASSQPLYVIDGFPISNDYDQEAVAGWGATPNQLNSIDPSNIASIQILKDASAAAIYGSRANNGVVIITTKRGKSGRAKLDYDNSISVSRVSKKFDFLNATEWAQLQNEADELNGNEKRWTDGDIAAMGEGTDWQDIVFRNAVTQRHKLSLSGGNESVRYLVAANVLDQKGLIIGTGFKRYGGSLNLDADLSKKLTLSANFNYTSSTNDQTINDSKSYSTQPSMVAGIFNAKPHVPPYDEQGNLAFARDYPGAGGEDTPLYMATMYDIVGTSSRLLAGMALNYEIVDGLNLKFRLGMDNLLAKEDKYYPVDSRVARSVSGYAEQADQFLTNFLNENTLEYKKNIGQHAFSFLGGFTYQTEKNRRLMATAMGFPSDFYSYHNLGLATNPQPPSSSTTKWALVSYLSRLNYIFADKYMFTATARYDGSSKFGANNKYGFFPSASVAWKLSEESFIKDLDVFSQLKIRLGYGRTGNERIGLYRSISTIESRNDFNVAYVLGGTQVPVAYPANIGNPDLTWEKGSDLNIGIDMGFFSDRLNLTLDIYHKKTTDMLLNVPIPVQNGFASVLTNIGEMQNKGFELSLYSVNLKGDFGWTTNLNYSRNQNEIIDLGGANHYFTGWVGGGNQNWNGNFIVRNAPGMPVGSFWGSTYDGIWTSQAEIDESGRGDARLGGEKFRDVNGDGVYDPQDDQYIGNPNPDFIFGLNNDFTYKNFSLNIFLYGEIGQDVANLSQKRMTGGTNLLRSDREDRWHPVNNPNGTTLAANRGWNSRLGTHNVLDASFVRIKNIALTYDMPVSDLGINWLSSLQLNFALDNVLVITNYNGYDPEVNSYGSTNDVKGVDRYGYPAVKGYRFGLRVGF